MTKNQTAIKYLGFLGKGLVANFAPNIAKGVLLELLKKRRVDVLIASDWVQTNKTLWDALEPAEQESLKRMAGMVDDLSWMDFKWAISAMKEDFPAVASLFLGWTKGKNWLTRQIEIIKKEVQG